MAETNRALSREDVGRLIQHLLRHQGPDQMRWLDQLQVSDYALRSRIRKLEEAAVELIEVAWLRGDNDLPHPSDDPVLWTGRMQDAWDDLGALMPDPGKEAE